MAYPPYRSLLFKGLYGVTIPWKEEECRRYMESLKAKENQTEIDLYRIQALDKYINNWNYHITDHNGQYFIVPEKI